MKWERTFSQQTNTAFGSLVHKSSSSIAERSSCDVALGIANFWLLFADGFVWLTVVAVDLTGCKKTIYALMSSDIQLHYPDNQMSHKATNNFAKALISRNNATFSWQLALQCWIKGKLWFCQRKTYVGGGHILSSQQCKNLVVVKSHTCATGIPHCYGFTGVKQILIGVSLTPAGWHASNGDASAFMSRKFHMYMEKLLFKCTLRLRSDGDQTLACYLPQNYSRILLCVSSGLPVRPIQKLLCKVSQVGRGKRLIKLPLPQILPQITTT